MVAQNRRWSDANVEVSSRQNKWLTWFRLCHHCLAGISLLFPAFLLAQTLPDYRVGGGDVLSIRVFQEDQLSGSYKVSADGLISAPLIGTVKIEGMTTQQISELFRQKLAADFLVNPQVTVQVAEYVSQLVHVLGAVKNPGVFTLQGQTSAITLVARAGGLTEQGSKMLLILRYRPTDGEYSPPDRIDMNALLTAGDTTQGHELIVKGGDVVFVPKADEVYVVGEVTHPGAVIYQDGLTLLQAISKVGAFKPSAAPAKVQIIRRIDGKEQIMKYDARKIQDGIEPDAVLAPGDLISVPRSVF